MRIFRFFLNNDHRSGDKSGIYIDAEAEAEAKFMLLLQTLFTLKQKHGGRSYGCESTAVYIQLAIGLHSINETTLTFTQWQTWS